MKGLTQQGKSELGQVEILIVDNNSSDNTKNVVEKFRDNLPVKYVFEREQGLTFARNAGINSSSGAAILFTDDDLRFDDKWLSSYLDALHSFPEASYFGGRILPDWTSPKPGWLKDEKLPLLDGILGCYDLGAETRIMTEADPLPFGASFAVRRAIFDTDRIELFRQDLGRQGTNLGRGEDTDMLNRIRQMGKQGVYVGKALCWHAVQPDRLKFPALWEYGKASGKAHYIIFGTPKRSGSYKSSVVYLLRGIWQLIKGHGDRFRQCVINAGIQVGLRKASEQYK